MSESKLTGRYDIDEPQWKMSLRRFFSSVSIEYVVTDEYGAYMIAQAGMHRGLIGVLGELLTYQRGNEFYRTQIPKSWEGQRFNDKMAELKTNQNAILVAVHTADGMADVNPENYVFDSGDEVVAICKGKLELA